VDASNYALAVDIAALPESIRGFGHIKDRNRAAYARRHADLIAHFQRDLRVAHAAD
jgi:indolepyruvate ferredoxin oxidoreductase